MLRSQLRWPVWIISSLPRSLFGDSLFIVSFLYSPRYNEGMILKVAVSDMGIVIRALGIFLDTFSVRI